MTKKEAAKKLKDLVEAAKALNKEYDIEEPALADPETDTGKEIAAASKGKAALADIESAIETLKAEILEFVSDSTEGLNQEDFNELPKKTQKTLTSIGFVPIDEEDAAEPEPEPKKEKKGKKAAAKKETKAKGGNGAGIKKVGVISTIQELVTSKGPITEDAIVKALVKKFPDRNEDSMRATVRVQLPGRMSKEKGINIIRTEKGFTVK